MKAKRCTLGVLLFLILLAGGNDRRIVIARFFQ